MELFWYVALFLLGTIIGSFLNVVIYRLHTGKSLGGRSHCMSCGKTLSWSELFPLFSYIAQGGRCRGCSARIPSRYFMIEILTGVLYMLMWHVFSYDLVLFVLHVILVSLCVVIVMYDIRHTVIPDELTVLVLIVACVYLGYAFLYEKSIIALSVRVVAGLIVATFFWGLWFISRGRWIGLGDAKLAFPLGILVGLGGIFSMVVLAFWIGAGVSLTLLGIERLLKRGKKHLHFLTTPLTIKSEVPFAPFLIAGFLLVELFHADIFTLTYSIFLSY